MKRILSLLIAVIAIVLSSTAQTSINIYNPVGTYRITDYLGKTMTLRINKGTPTRAMRIDGSYYETGNSGKATLTVNGRTIQGKWNHTLDDDYFAFNSYGGTRFVYNLPEGPAKTDQIIIWKDGRASYNASELMKTWGNWIKVKKVSTKSKAVSKKRRK